MFFGIAVGSKGEIILYGSSFISLFDSKGNLINKEDINGSRYILTTTLVGNMLVVSVFEFHDQLTRYYLINHDSGSLTELEKAIQNHKIITLEPWWWIPSIEKYFSTHEPGDSIELQISKIEDGFNRLGIITQTQNIGNELLVNDGFRFFSLCFESGEYTLRFQWNHDLNKTNYCTSVVVYSDEILIYTKRNDTFLTIVINPDLPLISN